MSEIPSLSQIFRKDNQENDKNSIEIIFQEIPSTSTSSSFSTTISNLNANSNKEIFQNPIRSSKEVRTQIEGIYIKVLLIHIIYF